MNKKHFSILFLFGSIVVLGIVPLFNYHIDQWRVLHNDLNTLYKGNDLHVIEPNKAYLKTYYILNNKDKYNMFLFGSSRVGDIDISDFPNRPYNMTYSLGVVGAFLNDIKLFISNGVAVKEIWIGLDDTTIWKNSHDYKKDYLRYPYKEGIYETLKFYQFYLFKKPSPRDIEIFKGEYNLINNTEIILNPNSVENKRLREKQAQINNEKHIQYISNKPPSWGKPYDKPYRINEAINEISEIVKLCKENNIKLVLFITPPIDKAYYRYDQNRMEEFKIKLSQIYDFHDFYKLFTFSSNYLFWRDANHYFPSIGDYIIENINKRTFLVKKGSYDISKKLNNIIYQLSPDELNLFTYGKKIFDIYKSKYWKNKSLQIYDKKLVALNKDPVIKLSHLKIKANKVILKYKIESSNETIFEIFYRESKNDKYSKKTSYQVFLKKGLNDINIIIPAKYINNELRLDLVSSKGKYKLYDFSIYKIKEKNE